MSEFVVQFLGECIDFMLLIFCRNNNLWRWLIWSRYIDFVCLWQCHFRWFISSNWPHNSVRFSIRSIIIRVDWYNCKNGIRTTTEFGNWDRCSWRWSWCEYANAFNWIRFDDCWSRWIYFRWHKWHFNYWVCFGCVLRIQKQNNYGLRCDYH